MYLGDSHASNHIDIETLLRESTEELEKIVTLHRYVTRTVEREFTASYDRHLKVNDPEYYDGGDAIWDAEKEIGVTPWHVDKHFGLLSLARGVSLAEVVMARMAAKVWEIPELTVFPNGKMWSRTWEKEFYRTVLNQRFDSYGNGFGPLRSLRDVYIHGYGVPVEADSQGVLARSLHQALDMSSLTAEEEALGYGGEPGFFGPYAKYHPKTGLTDTLVSGVPAADLSPVSTYRALKRIGEHVVLASEAVMSGPRDDLENSRFIKMVAKYWDSEKAKKAG